MIVLRYYVRINKNCGLLPPIFTCSEFLIIQTVNKLCASFVNVLICIHEMEVKKWYCNYSERTLDDEDGD